VLSEKPEKSSNLLSYSNWPNIVGVTLIAVGYNTIVHVYDPGAIGIVYVSITGPIVARLDGIKSVGVKPL
jgi:hypothetical protein